MDDPRSTMIAPSGIITLTTDMGHKGPFVAMMKGAILSRYAAATIIDLTHEIVNHWPAEAGFWLDRAHGSFPAGTVHMAVVDPAAGTSQQILTVRHHDQLFLAPDNGLLAPIFEQEGAETRAIDAPHFHQRYAVKVSPTFHGRDVLAPIAADLASGVLRFEDLGPVAEDLTPSWLDDAHWEGQHVRGVVVAVDGFGNLITNIDASYLTHFKTPHVVAGGHSLPVRRVYADAKPGEDLALVNSLGVIEVARSEQSAAVALGLSRGAPVTLVESSRR
jgi:hypothetical protein